MKIEMNVTIVFPKSIFEQYFLDCEVSKKLGTHGDDLFYAIRKEYQEDAKEYGKLFSRDIIYLCEDIGSEVKLTGISK